MEKKFTFNNAALVWWFIAWRFILVTIFLNFITFLGMSIAATKITIGESAQLIINGIVLILLMLVHVYLTKMAVNRDYKSKSNGSFRLIAQESSSSISTNNSGVNI
jgi:hypothetical protein